MVLDSNPAVMDSRNQVLSVAGFELQGVSVAGQVLHHACRLLPALLLAPCHKHAGKRSYQVLRAYQALDLVVIWSAHGCLQETCIILPRLKLAFDIGRCPQRSVFQQTVLVSHGHLDHIGGLPFHVASR